MCPQRDDEAYATGWQRQQLWSRTASAIRADIKRWRAVILALTILGAILETVAASGVVANGTDIIAAGVTHNGWRAWAAWLGTLALALVPIFSLARTAKDRVQQWIRSRSASEGLKSELYTYATRTPPYDDVDREILLQDAIDGISQKVADLAEYASLVDTPPTPPPPEMSVAEYAEKRVGFEIDWYSSQTGELARKLKFFRSVELSASVLAAVLGAVASITAAKQVGAWVSVVTTATAAVMAHVAAGRYEFRVQGYSSTAFHLAALRNKWRARSKTNSAGVSADAQFVRDCEAAISVETQGWMSELVRETRPAKPTGTPIAAARP